MELKTLRLGPLENNCYILVDNDNAIIIDPSDNSDLIIKNCANYKVCEILVTHHHFDHIGALKELEDYYHVKHNDKKSGFFDYKVIKTPGHSKDSISFYFEKEKVLFSGDFLFKDNIGRYDFPDSSIYDMQKSIELIASYDDDIVVYPGHGEKTTLLNEKKHFNFYFKMFCPNMHENN